MIPFCTLRQLLYPPEFRIPCVAWPANLTETLQTVVRAIEQLEAGRDSEEDKRERRMLADVCTGLWRLRQRMLQPGGERPSDEMRKAYRHLEAVLDALRQGGVEVRDHVGEPYNEGSGLDVAAFERRPGLRCEKVVEAIKPTITWNGHLLQVGQVIVGTPE